MFGQFPRGGMGGKGTGGGKPALTEIPPHLRMMFDPQAPIIFKPPVAKKEQLPMTGVGSLVGLFETTPPPKPKPFEAPAERKKKARERMQKLHKEKNDLLAQDWDPHHNAKATSNPYTTLFVGRLSYDVTDKKLRREFETYGPIRSVQVVTDGDGKSRGYAFIEFENENDMTSAVRKAEGRKIDGRRIVCDVERGRTVKNWRPARFGGGLGGRVAKKSKSDLADEALRSAALAAAALAANDGDRDRGDRGDRDRDRGSTRARSRSRDRRDDRRGDSRDRRDSGRRGSSRDRGGSSRAGLGSGGGGGGGSYYGPSSNGGSGGARDSSRDTFRDSGRGGDRDSRDGGRGGDSRDYGSSRGSGGDRGGSYRGRSRDRR